MKLAGWQAAAGCVVPDWHAPAPVCALTTTRALPGYSRLPFDGLNLGVNNGDDAQAVQRNRERLPELLHLPSAPCWLRQTHGTKVAKFNESATQAAIEADAAITSTTGVVLCILTADCLPLLLCADDGGEVAAIHAGWRGLAAGVIEQCIGRMRTPAGRLVAWLGPAIGPQSYEVGVDVRDAFITIHADSAAAFVPARPGHWLCDLYTLARQRLQALGVPGISGGGFDTFADARFFSHRRDRVTGRFASLIWIDGVLQ